MDSRLRGNDEMGDGETMEHLAQTKPYDSAGYLDSEEAIVTYLKVAFEVGDADDFRPALHAAQRSARKTESLKKSEVVDITCFVQCQITPTSIVTMAELGTLAIHTRNYCVERKVTLYRTDAQRIDPNQSPTSFKYSPCYSLCRTHRSSS